MVPETANEYCRNMLMPIITSTLNKTRWVLLLGMLAIGLSSTSKPINAEERFIPWQAKNFAITTPLAGLKGDPKRGRKLVAQRDKGNCLACHAMPINEEAFHGTLGPPLNAIASRLSPAEIRLRVVDQTMINPMTVMPAFYKDPVTVNRIAQKYIGKTILSAQEVEDVVAYLASLKQQTSQQEVQP